MDEADDLRFNAQEEGLEQAITTLFEENYDFSEDLEPIGGKEEEKLMKTENAKVFGFEDAIVQCLKNNKAFCK